MAYRLGADASEALPAGVPKGLRTIIATRLAPALEGVAIPGDLQRSRAEILDRTNLMNLCGDIITEVASNAQRSTPHARRAPNWVRAFGGE